MSHNPTKRPRPTPHEWKLMLEAHTTRGHGTGSDTKPHNGIQTPAPGTLRIDDSTLGPA